MADAQPLFEGISRVLVITAHPDDCDFGAAGTIALMGEAGIHVAYCICTDGGAGGFDPAIPREEMPRLRRAEQTAAAHELGVEEIHFLGYEDGALVPDVRLRHDIARVIRQVRPDRVLCQSPERNWRRIGASHPDHLAAGEAALAAVYPDARNPFAFPDLAAEGLEAHTVASTWVMAAPHPDTVVDVTDVFHRKIAALLHHRTQHPEPDRLEPRVREWSAALALEMGLPAGRLAEAFLSLDTA